MNTYPVKYTHSAMVGAPTISGAAGTLIAALDALLINGFNLQSVQSVSCTAGEATATFASAHGYAPGQIVLIGGATPDALNGEHYVTWTDSTRIRFATTAADGTATGAISCKVAPVGQWSKPFSGTNKAVYRSTDPMGTGLYLRVDDSTTSKATVRMYESMTDVDTGLGASTINYWMKSNSTDSTARGWRFIADSRLFFLGVRWSSSYPAQHGINSFGDIESYKAGDAYGCWLHGEGSNSTPGYPGHINSFKSVFGGEDYPAEIARSYTQVGSAVKIYKTGSRLCDYMGYSGSAYPSPVDNGLLLHAPVVLREGYSTGSPARGTLPGVLQPVQTTPLADGDIVADIPQMPGRCVLLVTIAVASSEGRAAFDITGPWR